MKKRIAIISEHASPLATLGGVDSGGQNLYVDAIAKEITKLGYEVDVFTRWDDKTMPKVITYDKGIRVIHIKAGPVEKMRKEDLISHLEEFTDNTLSYIKNNVSAYQIVHANFFMSGFIATRIKEELGIPFVITFHALGKVRRLYLGDKDEFSDARFEIEDLVIKKADEIIAECPQDKDDLVSLYKAKPEKISIIPCGFSSKEFYPIDKKIARHILKLDQSKKYILVLGRMVPRKGVDNVINALSLVKQRIKNAELIVVGGEKKGSHFESDPEIVRLKKIAQKKGVKSVKFVGQKNREELKYYYNASDLFVSTPWYEPFGITPLEAMACGIPVIGSNVGGIKFSVSHGKTGFLVPPKDPQSLSERIIEILEDQELSKRLSENAIKRVNAIFTWESVASLLSTTFERIIYSKDSAKQEYKIFSEIVDSNFDELLRVVTASQRKLRISIVNTARVISKSIEKGGKVIVCGNGGSASDSSHFSTELVGHFKVDQRQALPVLDLTGDSSLITAIGNDYSFNDIYSRQVEAFGYTGDILVAITTSGNSQNIVNAAKAAKKKDMVVVSLTGGSGGSIVKYSDISLVVPSENTQHIQEVHTHLIHTISELVERKLLKKGIREDSKVKTKAHIPINFRDEYGTKR